jgi:N-acetylglucosaminyl-diphospho-decaprenol L-rhamnosyltransferase
MNENSDQLRRAVDKKKEDAPELSIIITNYDGKDFLKACLSSIKENLHSSDVETIVIDNFSSDGSPEFVRENFPGVKLIRNHQNLGYAKANNQGIKEARGEFILLLNPDTVILPQAMDILRDEMRFDPTVGAVGPALLSGEDRFQVSFGRKISFFHELLQKSLLNQYFRRKLKKMREKREVGWLSGACILTRRSVLEEAGLFDEDFFLFFEDIDLCRRIKENGWKLIFIPQAKIIHVGGGSTAKLGKLSLYHYRQSQLTYYTKHGSDLSIFLLRVYLRINFALLFVSTCFKGDEDKESVRSLFKLLKKE